MDLRPEGLRVSGTSLWLDARRKTALSFVSHAHADHIARHQRLIATPSTVALAEYRLGTRFDAVRLEYRQPYMLDGVRLELFPAGHILGSAQLLIVRRDGLRIGYTGDLNLGPSLTAEPAEVIRCDVLILESTYGHPRYTFEPKEEILLRLEHWIETQLQGGRAPILLAYAIGKSQEVIKFLSNRGFKVRAHSSICDVLEIYSRFGVEFKGVLPFTGTLQNGEVGIFPPQSIRRGEIKHISPKSSAILTGWALDPAVIGRRADVAFALSDHADFAALVRCAKESGAGEVITHHGFARELAEELRKLGITARAIGQGLQLDFFGPPQVAGKQRRAA